MLGNSRVAVQLGTSLVVLSLTELELLGFWTLSILQNSKYKETQCFRNWIFLCLEMKGGRHLICRVP
jgi:hypothetical protein